MQGSAFQDRLNRLRQRRGAAFLDELQTWGLRQPVSGIHGWGLAERGLGRVEVSIDGERTTRARLFSIPRPEVGWDAPSAPISGWEAPIDLVGLEPGREVEVRTVASGVGWRSELGTRRMVIQGPPEVPGFDPRWLETLRARSIADAMPHVRGRRLRLLAFTHQLDLGGAQLYLDELLRRLLADGEIECTVFAQADGELRERLEAGGVEVHIAGQEPRVGSVYESRMRELVLLANRFEPDLVLANTTLAFPGIDLAERLGLPSIWAIHESVPVEHQPYMNWPLLDDHVRSRFFEALRTTDRLVFETDATADLYRDYAGPSNLTRIDYGIDLAALAAERADLDRERLRAERGLGDRDRLIVCMGTIEPRKAQASLALAFARIASRFPGARLALVGDRDTPYSRALREAVTRMGPRGRQIEVVPVTADTSSWYELADAFALPSDLESMPRSILEAMAFELPVLAADAFGVGEVVDESNGVLCEPRCLDSLAAALERLLALERGRLAELGAGGARTVASGHDSSGYTSAYRALIEELVAERSATDEPAPDPA